KVIGISRQGMDKLLSGNLLPTKYASAFHVPELIENAEYVASAPYTKDKQNINEYTYYDSPISIGGEDYVAHIRVRATDMGQKYYGHTISSEMAGIIDGIKIEPSARSSIDKSMLHPVKSLGSNLNIPQPTHDVNGDIVGASENIYRAPQWDERQRIDENNGTVYSAQSAGLHNRAEQDKIVELSAKLSVPIRFMNDTNANINGKYENGTIYINVNSKTPIKDTFVHELTHFTEASGLYNDFASAVLDSDKLHNEISEMGLSLNEYKDKIRTEYAQNGKELDERGIEREIVAKFAENFLKDERTITRLAETDKGLFSHIQSWIKDLLVRFKGTAEEKSLLKISKLYEKAFKDAKGKTAASGAQYHISQNAGLEIDSALNDKNYRQEVKLRDFTPQTLIDHGVQNLPMLMNASHLRQNIWTEQEAQANGYRIKANQNWHGLGKDLFMRVIDSLDNPLAVYRGTKTSSDTARQSNYFLIITALTDENGNKINVPVYVEQKGEYNDLFIDTNKIAT
ncbi:MAG: hypothetical protein RR424_11010, partial [Oscillospiraceae bacterium]